MTVTPRDPRRGLIAFGVLGLFLVAIVVVSVSVLTAPGPSSAPSATRTSPGIAATARPSPTDQPGPTPSPSLTPAPLPSAPPVVSDAALVRADPNGVWSISFRYPAIADGTSPFAKEVNASIKTDVELVATEFAAGPAANPSDNGRANTLTGSYSIALLTPGLLSFRLKQVEDLNAAHPSVVALTATYDLSTGQRVGFGDVFADMPGALSILSQKSRDALRRQLGDGYDPTVAEEGTNPTAANFANWALTHAGLEVTFQEYQVAAGAAGLPVVIVPWNDLKGVVDGSGPAAALLAGS